MHEHCRHYLLGSGCRYCARTQCVYVQPEDIPTEKGRKHRGGPEDVFARRIRGVLRVLTGIRVRACIMLTKGEQLPAAGKTIGDVITLRQDIEAGKTTEGTPK